MDTNTPQAVASTARTFRHLADAEYAALSEGERYAYDEACSNNSPMPESDK